MVSAWVGLDFKSCRLISIVAWLNNVTWLCKTYYSIVEIHILLLLNTILNLINKVIFLLDSRTVNFKSAQ